MAYIFLQKNVSETKYVVFGKILVNQDFLNCFDIDFGSDCFFEHCRMQGREPTVKDIIEWVETQLKIESEEGYEYSYKYQTKPRKFAVEKFLPKIKKWSEDLIVDCQ